MARATNRMSRGRQGAGMRNFGSPQQQASNTGTNFGGGGNAFGGGGGGYNPMPMPQAPQAGSFSSFNHPDKGGYRLRQVQNQVQQANAKQYQNYLANYGSGNQQGQAGNAAAGAGTGFLAGSGINFNPAAFNPGGGGGGFQMPAGWGPGAGGAGGKLNMAGNLGGGMSARPGAKGFEIERQGAQNRQSSAQKFGFDKQMAGFQAGTDWNMQNLRGEQALGQLGLRADLNEQSAGLTHGRNLEMLDATTGAQKDIGTHQSDLQRGLTQHAANLNLKAAQQQANLGMDTMKYGAGLQEDAAQNTFGRNLQAQEHAAGLTEDAAQNTFGRNLAMQGVTHGLNLNTMGESQRLNQLSAQQAQDRGFAGVNRMNQMMFGGEGGGMFGQMMDRFGGGNQPQGGGGNPQFGDMGNFAQTGAGAAAAQNYANNPFSGAMAHMSQQPSGGPPGATQGQGVQNANAAMMAQATNAANAGQLAGQADMANYGNVMGTAGAMAGAGQNAAAIAAQRAAPGLGARAGLQAGAIQSMGNMFGGFA